jgi:hypothetical protein
MGRTVRSSEFRHRAREFLFFSKIPDRRWDPTPASCSVGTGVLSRRLSGRGVTLTTHRHLAMRLRLDLCVYPPPSPICFHDVSRDSFTFTSSYYRHISLFCLWSAGFKRTFPHPSEFSRSLFPAFTWSDDHNCRDLTAVRTVFHPYLFILA